MKTKKRAAGKVIARQYRWQLDQARRGLCRKCTRKISRRSTYLCDAHLLAERVRMRIRAGYAPSVAAEEGKFKVGRKLAGARDRRVRRGGRVTPK